MSTNNSEHYFFKGGGEMGELIRAKDWSKTALGDPAHWPQSLRTMVAVMLDNPFGMYIAWGNEYIQLYNDGYRPILGATKHPQALGIGTKETFAEIWHIIEPMFDGVMNGKAVGFPDFMLPLNRNGFVEACYFDFSYSPIRKDDGEVGGVLVTVIETTNKKKAEVSLQESNQRFRNVMKQAPVGITILRGPEYLVEMANDAYLQLVDKKEAEFVGKPLFTSLPEVKEVVHSLLDGVLSTGVPYHGYEVPVPINRYGKQDIFYFDFLYHPLKEENGEISGVFVAVNEATEKVATRKNIEESKRLYETITQNTPDLIYVFGLNYLFRYANDALLKMWGLSWDEAIGKSLLENGYEPWHAEMHEREIDEVVATKKSVRGEVSFPHATLGKRIYDYILVPVIDQEGNVEAVAGTTRDITQQVEARQQIEASEMRFRNMVEQAPVAISVLRGENYVVEVANEKQLQLWGKTKEQVLNNPIFSAIPEGAGQGFEQLLHEVLTTGNPFMANEYPTTLIRHGKEEIFYSNFIYEPLYDSENKIGGVISVATDVTEQVIARKKIEESEERFRSLAQTLPQLVWLTDAQGNSEFASSRWMEYSGIEPNGEKEWRAIVHPDDYDQINAAWLHSLTTGDIYAFDVRLKSKTGEYRWHTVKGEPVLDKDNKIVKWVGAFTDTHAEKTFAHALEDKVKTRTIELQASEEKFHILFNLSPICKTLTDALTGKIVMVNDAFTHVFGYSREETLNKSSAELGIIDNDARETVFNELKAQGKIQNIEIAYIKKSGEKFFALTSAEIITLKDKQYFLAAYNDISEIKRAEQNIMQKNIELEQMNNELQSFAYISSHDLQEPLRKIQTFANFIAEKEVNNLSDSGKDMFNRMQNSAKRMQTLIQDLLAYSRTNTTEHQFETTDLNKIIAEVKEELKEELEEKHAVIENHSLGEADIIPFQFRQLLHNLISNALKFSNQHQAPIIQIKSEMVSGSSLQHPKLSVMQRYCHITVSDNGIGFDQKYSEKIFEVFQRLHGRGEYEGTGIGLSIVKKIVENHNGIITASGEINKGATFDIYIPAA